MPDQYRGYRHPFLVGTLFLGGVGDNPRTLSELAMIQLSAELRRREDWWLHFQDPSTRQSWIDEARDRTWIIRTPSAVAEVQLTQQQIEYIVDELSGYSALRDGKHGCQVSCFERIWETYSLLKPSVLSNLNSEVSEISKKSSLNAIGEVVLLDPLLHPMVYNRTLVSFTRARRRMPAMLNPPVLSDIYTLSQRFCSLPTDFFVSQTHNIKFLSYINNLHPSNSALYGLLEQTLNSLVPLFEHTLTDLHRNNPLGQRIPGPCRYTIWDEPDPPEYSDDEEGWAEYERNMRHWAINRPINLPDVAECGYSGGLEHRKHRVCLKDKRLQIIIKITDIRLSPDVPVHAGSPWHVEGMRNERVVACGFYYVSVENVTDSSLQFRMAVTYPRGFNAGDSGATLRTWGLQDGDSCHQHIGSVPIRQGLGIVFPNIYQHRQAPIRLTDPTMYGHQTCISFMLVDPDIRPIVSTSSVAPQQREWISEAVSDVLGSIFPTELLESIMAYLEDSLMDQSTAQTFRNEMKAEREKFWDDNDNYHFCIPFDIWNGPEVLH